MDQSQVNLIPLNATYLNSSIAFPDHAANVARERSLVLQAWNIPIFEVTNTLSDERFQNHPFVRFDPMVRSMTTIQIVVDDIYPVGLLCVFDKKPKRLRSDQINALSSLARITAVHIESRKKDKVYNLPWRFIVNNT